MFFWLSVYYLNKVLKYSQFIDMWQSMTKTDTQ